MTEPLATRDEFLGALEDAGVDLDRLVEHCEPGASRAPDAAHKARLLERLTHAGRFERFAAQVAAMLDLPVDRARALLDGIADERVWSSDIPVGQAYWLPGGPRVADCVRGFVRIAAGETFPRHEHLGEERKLVLQGAFVDGADGRCYRAGELQVGSAGSCHGISVPAGGVDLLALVVTKNGYRIGDDVLKPRDV